MKRSEIFVSIASYRDPECQWTIKDLFEKARHPERIIVGLCNQIVEREDAHCLQVTTRPEQVRELRVDAHESKGCCWARSQCQSLWRGEDYFLQIDSHMRFVRGWDRKLVSMLALCPSDKAILSSYAPTYRPPNRLGPQQYVRLRAHHFHRAGALQMRSTPTPISEAPAAPEQTPFCSAHFLFGRSSMIAEVPYDPYIYFWGEEITLAARLWTSGWDIYAPNRVIVYHRMDNSGRRRHWDDHPQGGGGLQDVAAPRVRHILGMETSDNPEAIRELERYGLGRARSLHDYELFSNVDFRRRLIDGRTDDDIMIEDPVYRQHRNEEIFHTLRHNEAKDRARGGSESALAATETIRSELPRLFDSRKIEILGDAGCGDMLWIGKISESLRLYLGFDVVEDVIKNLCKVYGRRRGHFFATTDITVDILPACDAILCRDVLNYLPLAQIKEALKLFKASGSRYLIATTHAASETLAQPAGTWRPISLTAPPFNFPPPAVLIPESIENAKSLGLWELSDLPE